MSFPILFRRRQETAAPAAPLLDTYTALLAVSTRLLRTAYAGSCLRVRRDDTTETNVGFSGGSIDTASLLAFVGAGTGTVTTWYDQSGNARDLPQATASRQPTVATGGAYVGVTHDGTEDRLVRGSGISILTNVTIFVALKNSAAPPAVNTGYFANNSNDSNIGSFALDFSASNFRVTLRDATNTTRTITGPAYTTNEEVVCFRCQPNAQHFKLGSSASTASATHNFTPDYTRIKVGSNIFETTLLNGKVREVIVFGSYLSDADSNTIGANMAAAHGATWINL